MQKKIVKVGRSTYKVEQACFSSVKPDAEHFSTAAHVLSKERVHIMETKSVVN
jgi:hypothetical protein